MVEIKEITEHCIVIKNNPYRGHRYYGLSSISIGWLILDDIASKYLSSKDYYQTKVEDINGVLLFGSGAIIYIDTTKDPYNKIKI